MNVLKELPIGNFRCKWTYTSYLFTDTFYFYHLQSEYSSEVPEADYLQTLLKQYSYQLPGINLKTKPVKMLSSCCRKKIHEQ